MTIIRTYVVQFWGLDRAEFSDTPEGFAAAVQKLEDMRSIARSPSSWSLIYRTEREVSRGPGTTSLTNTG